MSDVRPALLALPPPAALGAASLRASLRSAAAMPVEAVQAARPAPDPLFREEVGAIERHRPSNEPGIAAFPAQRIERFAQGGGLGQFLSDHSVPFLAQQLGQGMRLVSPTLEPIAEVAAYAAAQQRADRAAQARQAVLDLHA